MRASAGYSYHLKGMNKMNPLAHPPNLESTTDIILWICIDDALYIVY